MRILIACEFSGIVREAFHKKGHDVWSCDFLPSEIAGKHIQGDVILTFNQEWDMMIAFPPCTHLCISGARWFKEKREEQSKALEFVRQLLDAPIPKICLENPVGIISTKIRKPDQIIQPYWFGEPESKKTCLWLKNLPLLKPTNILEKPMCGYWKNQTPGHQNKLGPSEDRWKLRSKTYAGIAIAMSAQWG